MHSFHQHQVNKDKYCLSDELAIDEFRQLHRILASAASCREEAQSEAAWNALAHSPLLHHAVESSQCPQVTPFIATTARIIPALLPRNIYTGHAVGGRLVFSPSSEPLYVAESRSPKPGDRSHDQLRGKSTSIGIRIGHDNILFKVRRGNLEFRHQMRTQYGI
ncbi:uncharacterized protein B0I36DRAFT_80472 [Microdochium trichocladiopsis]|uniref:PD-(D/E)XK nuclease-like domain-containing protein n=1 Tax=Microdochium trichocladiopsis TaxID=1682393 RepID=A0A9P8XP94_9PEZI|nr:uncharacterized protein B0I36DRAFT_80472 [Microdochium trichocladiopsis]KAH7007955.1 hypothetical protein B0I36DRAFT_80472 [Microdochium trichocladiopsis]